jgi:hypothetical protein
VQYAGHFAAKKPVSSGLCSVFTPQKLFNTPQSSEETEGTDCHLTIVVILNT